MHRLSLYKTIIGFILIFSCCILHLEAQNNRLKFNHFNVSNGLSNSTITCFYQDFRGFIWVGTDDGLNRYDGYRFNVYRHITNDSTSLVNNEIRCMYEDAQHNLWIGTSGGLLLYNRNKDNFRSYFTPYPVNAIIEDKQHGIWYGLENGELATFDPIAFKAKYIHKNEFNLINIRTSIRVLWADNKGNIWIGRGGNGLNSYNPKTNKFSSYLNKSLKENKILCFDYNKNENCLWVGTSEGFQQFDLNKNEYVPFNERDLFPSKLTIYSITHDGIGNMWIGSDGGGLFKFNPKTKLVTNYTYNTLDVNGISNNKTRLAFVDNQSNIWVGNFRGGINVAYHYKDFKNYQEFPTNNKMLSNAIVSSMFADNNDNIWVGTDGGGLNLFHPSTETFEHLNEKIHLPDLEILALHQQKNGIMWIGTFRNGLYAYNPKTGSLKNYNDDINKPSAITGNDVRAITEDKKGNIWVGINGGGICKLDMEMDRFQIYQQKVNANSLVNNWIRCLYSDNNGKLWIGTFGGLSVFDEAKKTFENYNRDEDDRTGKNQFVVMTIMEDSRHQLWIGSTNGLKLFNKKTKKFRSFTDKDGLPGNVINGIIEGNDGYLWLSTNNGICKFDILTFKMHNFDLHDGLAGNEFIYGSFCKARNGRLYFGGTSGMVGFMPEHIKISNKVPPVLITDFKIFNKLVTPNTPNSPLTKSIIETNEIILNHNQAYFTFEFTILNFNNPARNKFKYMLEGFDKTWISSGTQNTVTYTNIPSGKYIFKALGANNDGVWNTVGISIVLIVRPPFWLTWWAFVIYGLLFLGAVYLSFKLIVFRESLKNEIAIERLKADKAKEIYNHKNDFFSNISHELKTPLTLILGPLEKLIANKDPNLDTTYYYQLMQRNTQRLYRLITQILDLNKIEDGKLSLTIQRNNLMLFVRNIADAFNYLAIENKIRFEVNTEPEDLEMNFDLDKMEQVLVNLISNAFKFTPEYGNIIVVVSIVEIDYLSNVKIVVQDSGCGISASQLDKIFERFYQVNDTKHLNPTGTGIGLELSKRLVELHHGRIEVASTSGVGSTFTVYLPTNLAINAQSIIPNSILVDADQLNDKELLDDNTSESNSVLLIEDNSEVRLFLRLELEREYTIIEAVNGIDGLEQAEKHQPDLIISDVMMPKMNGIELCKRIKTSINTSHIPIILLTARSTVENQLEGLENGADAYINKPFNINVLKLQIRNMLKLRMIQHEKFNSKMSFEPKEVSIVTNDEKFINKAMNLIEDNIGTHDYNVDLFVDAMSMSRTIVYAKIKALTGLGVNEFIQSIRLKRASQLLDKSDMTIAEICYEVGFNNPQYFSKCFKKQFGMLPTDYKKVRV